MAIYAGLDVSDKTTHVCVVDGEGVVLHRDAVASDPEFIARWLARHCPGLVRVVHCHRQAHPRAVTPDLIRGPAFPASAAGRQLDPGSSPG